MDKPMTLQEASERDPAVRRMLACAASMGNCIIKKKVKPHHTPQ
jgi:hypothetical protein